MWLAVLWRPSAAEEKTFSMLGLMIYILHYLKDPKLWELWYSIVLITGSAGFISEVCVCVFFRLCVCVRGCAFVRLS